MCTPIFIVALLTIGKISKSPKCPLIDERIKKKWYRERERERERERNITQPYKRMKLCHL